MDTILLTLFLDNPCPPEQVCAFCSTFPEFRDAEAEYQAAEQEIEERLGHDLANRFDEAQSRYMPQLVQAYYLFGLGLRQEVLSALGTR